MKRVGGLFLYAILAGFCIGLGGTVFLKLKDAFPGGNVVGALLFTIGLFTVCTRGYALFTGKACYLFDNPLPAYLLELLVFWVGNLLGAMLIAGLEHLTGMVGGETGIDATAAALVEGKMGATYLGLFVLGILCNICIFIAVNGYANNPHQVGKYLALFLGVSVFILCGTEHSVADMYYWSVSGVLYAQPGESVLRLLIISLGNVVGGVFFPLMEKGNRRHKPPKPGPFGPGFFLVERQWEKTAAFLPSGLRRRRKRKERDPWWEKKTSTACCGRKKSGMKSQSTRRCITWRRWPKSNCPIPRRTRRTCSSGTARGGTTISLPSGETSGWT